MPKNRIKKHEKCMVLAQGEGRVFWGFYRPACNITAGAAWISTFLTPPDQPFPLHCLLLPSVSCPPPTVQHPGGLAPLVAQGVKGWYPACEGSVRGQSSGLTCRLDGGPPQSELSVLPPSHPLCPELLCTLSLPPLVCVGVPFQFVCHAGPVCSYERTGVTQSVSQYKCIQNGMQRWWQNKGAGCTFGPHRHTPSISRHVRQDKPR